MGDIISKEAVLHLVKKKLLGNGTQIAAARKWKVSAAYISKVLTGKFPPPRWVLTAIGVEATKEIVFRRKE